MQPKIGGRVKTGGRVKKWNGIPLYLYINWDEQDQLGHVLEKEIVDEKGNHHLYRWINGVKLNGKKDGLRVNSFSYELFNQEKDKITFHCRSSLAPSASG